MPIGIVANASIPRTGASALIKMLKEAGSIAHSYPRPASPRNHSALPDRAAVLRRHRRSGLARECLGEVRVVGHGAVHPPLRRRVRIGLRLQPRRVRTVVRAPGLREGDEEVLLGLRVYLSAALLPQ